MGGGRAREALAAIGFSTLQMYERIPLFLFPPAIPKSSIVGSLKACYPLISCPKALEGGCASSASCVSSFMGYG